MRLWACSHLVTGRPSVALLLGSAHTPRGEKTQHRKKKEGGGSVGGKFKWKYRNNTEIVWLWIVLAVLCHRSGNIPGNRTHSHIQDSPQFMNPHLTNLTPTNKQTTHSFLHENIHRGSALFRQYCLPSSAHKYRETNCWLFLLLKERVAIPLELSVMSSFHNLKASPSRPVFETSDVYTCAFFRIFSVFKRWRS